MERLLGCFFYLLFIGVLLGLGQFGSQVWEGISTKAADGNNLLWLSIGVFCLFAVWQILGLIQVYQSPKKIKLRGVAAYLIVGASVLCFLMFLIFNYLAFYGSAEAQEWVRANSEGVILSQLSFFSVLIGLAIAIVISVAVGTTVFTILLLSRVGIGALVALLIHNWANGAPLDFSVLAEAIVNIFVDVSLSDFVGLLFTIIWFAISQYLINSSSIDTALE